MSKQRDYIRNPRRAMEFDTDYRGDLGDFEPTLAVQSEKDACDINNIMARYTQTGQLPAMMQQEPMYGDFSDAGTFQEALDIVKHAQAQFAALDAKVRAEFENDPVKMLAFVDAAATDESKAKRLVEMGLAIAREGVNPPPPAPAPAAPRGE